MKINPENVTDYIFRSSSIRPFYRKNPPYRNTQKLYSGLDCLILDISNGRCNRFSVGFALFIPPQCASCMFVGFVQIFYCFIISALFQWSAACIQFISPGTTFSYCQLTLYGSIFHRESAAGVNKLSYFLAVNVCQLPIILISPLIYLSLQYSFTSPRGELILCRGKVSCALSICQICVFSN